MVNNNIVMLSQTNQTVVNERCQNLDKYIIQWVYPNKNSGRNRIDFLKTKTTELNGKTNLEYPIFWRY